MIELAAFVALAAGVAGIGLWLGIIVGGRIDRRLSPPDPEPLSGPHEEQP